MRGQWSGSQWSCEQHVFLRSVEGCSNRNNINQIFRCLRQKLPPEFLNQSHWTTDPSIHLSTDPFISDQALAVIDAATLVVMFQAHTADIFIPKWKAHSGRSIRCDWPLYMYHITSEEWLNKHTFSKGFMQGSATTKWLVFCVENYFIHMGQISLTAIPSQKWPQGLAHKIYRDGEGPFFLPKRSYEW